MRVVIFSPLRTWLCCRRKPNLKSSTGNIGTAAQRMQLELYQQNDSHTEFWLNAANNIHTDITGHSYQQTGGTYEFVSHARDLTGSGIVDVRFHQGSVTTFGVQPELTRVEFTRSSGSVVDLEPTVAQQGYSIVTDLFAPELVVMSTFDPDAVYDQHQFTVQLVGNTIDFAAGHGFESGQSVVYLANGTTAVGGLVDGHKYYVVKVSDTVIKLAKSKQEALGTGFIKSGINGSNNVITLPYAHGFADGDRVVYDAKTMGQVIAGLVDGDVYFVDIDTGSTNSLRLAKSLNEAQELL